MQHSKSADTALQVYHNPGTAARELAIREPDNEEARAQRLADADVLEEKLKFITENVPVRVQNIMGSNAGAGSGEFHMYRQARRREQMRLTRIEEQDKRSCQLADHKARREELEAKMESKTAKLRAKRNRKKEKQQSAKRKNPDSSADSGCPSSNVHVAAAHGPDIGLD